MVLVLVVGWALQRFAGVREAMVLALFVGLIAAQFVPLGGSRGCGVDKPESRS